MQINSKITSGLTTLWALSESGLGGVLYTSQSTFTGLFVVGFAIMFISLLVIFSIIVIYYFLESEGNAVWKNWVHIFLKSFGILLISFYVISALCGKYFKKYREVMKSGVLSEVYETLTLLPYLRKVTSLAWNKNKDLNKLCDFMSDKILNNIHLKIKNQ